MNTLKSYHARTQSEARKPPLVLYHDSCNDGFCAAWLFRRYVNPNAEFVAVQYGDEPPENGGRVTYILDFSFKRDVLLQMMRMRKGAVCVLDHHKTAEKELADLPEEFKTCVYFDMEKSGARLTWEILCLSGADSFPPWLVDYTEDRDLWRWKLPNSREVSAALFSYPREFGVWDEIYKRGEMSLITEGGAILRYQDEVVASAVKHAIEVEMAGHKVLSVNATTLVSETATVLAKGRPFGVVWFATESKIVFSLRSASDGIDVSEIAKLHDGGGHKHAAGFSLPWLKIGKETVIV